MGEGECSENMIFQHPRVGEKAIGNLSFSLLSFFLISFHFFCKAMGQDV